MRSPTAPARRPRRLHSPSWRIGAFPIVLSCGLLSLALIAANSGNNEEALPPPVAVVNDEDFVLLPTPTRNITRGEAVRDVPYTMMKWPKSRLTGDYLSAVTDKSTARAIVALPRYLPIPLTAVSERMDEQNAVVEGIPTGMRAITVRVDIESAVEGWAQSGSFVDVILVTQSTSTTHSQEARVIADNIRILSAGRSTEPADSNGMHSPAPATATLLTTQEQALAIKAASSLGKLTFALRGASDTTPSSTITINSKAFISLPPHARSDEYRGFAKGPDGRHYLLLKGSRWIERGKTEGST